MANLVNPVFVSIQPLDRASERMDPEAREPVRTVRPRPVFEIPAQVSFREEDRPDPSAPGVTLRTSGDLVVLVEDLRFQDLTLERGDRITRIGNLDVDLYVLETVPFAFQSDVGGPTLLRVRFVDRSPA